MPQTRRSSRYLARIVCWSAAVPVIAFACTEQKPTELDPTAPPVALPTDGGDASVGEDVTPVPGDEREYDFVPVSAGELQQPIDVAARAGRIYVAEQPGRIRVVAPDGTTSAVALDITDKVTNGYDQGLLGFTFHPAFPSKPFLYVTYTSPHPDVPAPENISFQSVVARFESDDGGLTFSAATELRLLVWDHPGVNHNNNNVVFGPDGFLYIGSGDGSDPADLFYEDAQRTDTLLGKILRIDVDTAEPYAIPPSNPFADGGGRPEIYALGLRNPWRFDFDSVSKRLFAGDVGHLSFEEVNEIVLGGNYGWGRREGFGCFDAGAGCDGEFIDPLLVYGRDEGGAIVGGIVYRGSALPELAGRYVYSDAQSGYFWAVSLDSPSPEPTRIWERPFVRGVAIRADEAGEILVADYSGGRIVRLARAAKAD